MQNNTFKALAHPVRRDILTLLKHGPALAGDIAGHFNMAWPTVSRHISVLKDADLITAERQGTQILYQINMSVMEDFANHILDFVDRKNNSFDAKRGDVTS